MVLLCITAPGDDAAVMRDADAACRSGKADGTRAVVHTGQTALLRLPQPRTPVGPTNHLDQELRAEPLAVQMLVRLDRVV